MDMKTELFASHHFEKYEAYFDQYDKNSISAKHKIFNVFFGKEYKQHLSFILEKTKGFGCSVSNWDLDPQQYELVSEHFLYGILVSKIYDTVHAMKSIVASAEEELKKEFGENYKYELVKSIGDYFNIDLHIWTVDYTLTNGTAQNIKIEKTNKLELNQVLDKFFALSKEGQYVPDSILFSRNIIKTQDDFNKRTADKIKAYNEMIAGKSIDQITDYPKAVIFSVTKSLNLQKLSINNDELVKKYGLTEETVNSLDKFSSFEFYILGLEPLSIDCAIKPRKLFM